MQRNIGVRAELPQQQENETCMQITSTYKARLFAGKTNALRLSSLTHASRLHTQHPHCAITKSRAGPSTIDNQMSVRVGYTQGKLCARPQQDVVAQSAPAYGLQPLGTGARRDGLIYTPRSYKHGNPTPLFITMHGAGGNAKGALFPPLEEIADRVRDTSILQTV